MQTTLRDSDTERGLALAARGDWHAAATAFEAALVRAERGSDLVVLAAALTNLGQARAYLDALHDAAELLTRSVEARNALVERAAARPAIAARGYCDLAAVQAAAGDGVAAIATLERARTALGAPEPGSADAALAQDIEAGLASTRRGRGPAPAATSLPPR